MAKQNRNCGAGLLCGPQGDIQEVIFDDLLHLSNIGHYSLQDLVDSHSWNKLGLFQQEIQENGAALSWELNIKLQQGPQTMVFFGLAREEGQLVIISESAQSTFMLYEELLRIVNEQSRLLRFAQKESQESQTSRQRDLGILDQLSEVNNILMNTQRELSRKNYQLEREQKRFLQLINSNQDAILVVDKEQRIRFANPAAEKILGLSQAELMQERFSSHMRQESPLELQIWKNDGSNHVAEVRSSKIDWDQEEVYLVSLRDITARKQAERLQEEVQQMTRHDLKTPLNAIIGIPQLLLDEENLTQQQKDLLGYIEASGHRMLDMINQSLHLYHMEMGSYELNPQKIDLLLLLRRIQQDLQNILTQKSLGLSIQVQGQAVGPKSQFLVLAEEGLCYTMLGNLLLNAAEASPEKAWISINLESTPGKNVIQIHNQGAVPEDIRGSFFEKLVTKGKKQGTGLGTYSARLMAKVHGGEIFLQSSQEQGTLISIHLPDQPGQSLQ
ncbi:MAG: PAS domain-containing sensor histidine kinase [Thermodesulfobacteriota bacterium]